MKLKEFLKPDWRKIVLTVIIIIVWLFFWYWFYSVAASPPLWPTCCDLIKEDNLTPICKDQPNNPCCQFTLELCERLKTEREKQNLISSVTFFGSFILSYPISCFIIWIYDKYKKKRIR